MITGTFQMWVSSIIKNARSSAKGFLLKLSRISTVFRVCFSLVMISGWWSMNLSNSILLVRMNFIRPHRVLSKRYSSSEMTGFAFP
jgi:hypothetical protein